MKEKIKISLSVFFLIIAIIIIFIMGFIIYKSYNEKSNEITATNNANISTNTSTESSVTKTNDSTSSTTTSQSSDVTKKDNVNVPTPEKGKILVKRNGKITLENVPTNLIGTYVNKDDSNDYFTINGDGTFYITAANGDSNDNNGRSVYNQNNASYQLTYIHSNASSIDPEIDDENVMIEFYTNTYNGWLPSPFRLGSKTAEGDYVFSVLENTPSASMGEYTYQKK